MPEFTANRDYSAPETRTGYGPKLATRIIRHIFCAVLGLTLATIHPITASAQDSVCGQHLPEAVVDLAYGSRYDDDSVRKDIVDESRDTSVNAALKPVDDFIRSLSRLANTAMKNKAESAESARCAVEMLMVWAKADGLSELGTENAKMTIGARLAGIALSYSQVSRYATDEQRAVIHAWLERLVAEQIAYWTHNAPKKVRGGNLKAWAALAAISTGTQTGNTEMVSWGERETTELLCSVDADGAIPREMERGARALHYQLHAINALSTSAAILQRNGSSIKDVCGGALKRAVWYAVRDIESGGSLSRKKTGIAQTYFTGNDTLEQHHVAFGASFLFVSHDAQFAVWIDRFGTLNNSKLGGMQKLLWGA